jgi:hypothetical protein
MPPENDQGASGSATDQGDGKGGADDGNNAAGDGQQQQQSQQQQSDDALGDAGKRALEQERAARRDAEKLLKDTQAALKKLEDAGKSELQKAQDDKANADRELASRDERIRTMEVSAALEKEAKKQGAIRPDAVARLADAKSIELDSEGKPKDVAKTVQGLVKEYPEMFSPGGGNGSVPGGARPPAGSGGDDMDARIRRATGR